MPRSALALLLLPLLAVAAPVPKPPPKKVEEVFGQVADVSGVTCEMTRHQELRVCVSKDAATSTPNPTARPLACRTVEGDFELTVRVSHPPAKAADLAAVGTTAATETAGLALYAEGDPKKTLSLLHKHVKAGDTWKSQMSMNSQHQKGGSGTGRQGKGLEDKPLYLRLTRRGDEFTSQTSTDGKKWTAFGKHNAPGFGSVVVGPVASHNTTADHDAVFDEYEIKPLPAEEKK